MKQWFQKIPSGIVWVSCPTRLPLNCERGRLLDENKSSLFIRLACIQKVNFKIWIVFICKWLVWAIPRECTT
jgi:hypothetical protein